MRAILSVVVDGQFGSCGKGAVAAYLAHPANNPNRRVVAVRIGGPNAGHTTYGPACGNGCVECDQWGHPWRLRQLPTAAVSNPDADLVVGAGSEIDLSVLRSEVDALEETGIRIRDRLYVDQSATILTEQHQRREGVERLNERIGSTGKGIGAARADRIMRSADTVNTYIDSFVEANDGEPPWIARNTIVIDTAHHLDQQLAYGNRHVIIEGTQGYGLGLHTRFYPQTTSGDCRAIDFLAQAGISPWQHDTDLQVWVVVRPNPIRVAGNSGPLAGETTWFKLDLPEEHTTVTKKVRRVGAWDAGLVADAIRANGGPSPTVRVALTMGDHVDYMVEGTTDRAELTPPLLDFVAKVEKDTGSPVQLVGTSPVTLVDLR